MHLQREQPSDVQTKLPTSQINVSLQNILMHLRKVSNHPYLIEWPFDKTVRYRGCPRGYEGCPGVRGVSGDTRDVRGYEGCPGVRGVSGGTRGVCGYEGKYLSIIIRFTRIYLSWL